MCLLFLFLKVWFGEMKLILVTSIFEIAMKICQWAGPRMIFIMLWACASGVSFITLYRLFWTFGKKLMAKKTQNSSLKPKKSALFKNYRTFLSEKLQVLIEKHKR